MTSAIILEDRGVLAISGPDWRDFLQNLVSNDLDALTPETPIYAALLTPQGKYLFDFIMVEHEDGVLLDTALDRLPDLERRLTMYKLRADVGIENASHAWQVVALPDGAGEDQQDLIIFEDPREPKLGARALVPAASALLDLGWTAAPADAYEQLRIGLAVPDSGSDLVVDKTLLLEADFERLHGVSFSKGCYIGQELTARTKHRGNIRRRLYPVSLDAAVETGTEVLLEGKPVGDIRSVAGRRAIAFLRIEDVDRATAEGLLMVAGSAGLKVEAPGA